MPKTKLTVNGVQYDSVEEDCNERITLSSTKHATVMVTTLDELQTQYSARAAYHVKIALGKRV